MSNELVVAGAGAVAVHHDSGAVVEHVGDVSVDRGVVPATIIPANSPLMRDLRTAVGFDITPIQVQKAQEVFRQNRLATDEREQRAAIATLRQRWGSQYERQIEVVREFLKALPLGLGDELMDCRDGSGTAIFNKIDVMNAMFELAMSRRQAAAPQKIGESPRQPEAMASRRRALEAMMRDTGSDYYKGAQSAALQAEYRDLIDRGVPRDGGVDAPSGDVDAEMLQIRALMRDENSRYWKGSQAEYLQRRYRELLGMREGRQ